MRVSVVIPVYDRAERVRTAVASVLAQTFTDLEAVVVDDGSRDDPAGRLRGVGDPRVRCVRQPHAGVSAARDLGVRIARGELVAFLDSDDEWLPDKLAHAVAFLDRHPEAGAVFSDLVAQDGHVVVPSSMRDSPVFARMLAERPGRSEILFTAREMLLCLLQEVPIMPSALTVRREAFLSAGGFDASWRAREDWELLLRLAVRIRFGYVDRPLAVLRVSADSLHRLFPENGRTRMVARLRALRRAYRDDAEARAAATAGLVLLRTHLGRSHRVAGRRVAALRNYAAGFVETRQLSLAARAAGALLPATLEETAQRLQRALAARRLEVDPGAPRGAPGA